MKSSRLVQGGREYLLGRAECIADTLRGLGDLFERRGARRVMPSAFEPLEALAHPEHALIVRLRDEPAPVALRQDLTQQIRRIVDRELAHLPPPFRLYYLERVWVDDGGAGGRPVERLQAGFEWIEPVGPQADRDLLALALATLALLGVSRPTLTLGDARLRAAWQNAWRCRDEAAAVAAIERRDRSAWAAAGDARWPELPWLLVRGPAELPTDAPAAVAELIAELAATADPLADRADVVIDPTAAPAAEYYTGLTFSLSAGKAHDPWLRGGRYGTRYDTPGEALGFTLDLDPPLEAMERGLLPLLRRPRWLWLGPGPAPELAEARTLAAEPGLADPAAWAAAHGFDGLLTVEDNQYVVRAPGRADVLRTIPRG